MNEPTVKVQSEELGEVKENILMTWGDLLAVDEGIFHNDPSQSYNHTQCAMNHVDYLWYLFTGEYLAKEKFDRQ